MKFEDLKLPDLSGPSLVVAIHTARAVYDQMRAHYEADKKQPASEWRLPDPPPGRGWHRTDWTQDMLVDSEGSQYRPLLLGEMPEKGDQILFSNKWKKHTIYQLNNPVKAREFHQRTRRPLPAPVEYVPLEPWEYVPLEPGDIQPGSVVRRIGTKWWKQVTGVRAENITVCAAGNLSWQTLADNWEILCPGSITWGPCKKIKQ